MQKNVGELTVIELERAILNDFVLHKIRSGALDGISGDDLKRYSIEGGKEAIELTFAEAKNLKNEMLELINDAIDKYSNHIVEKICRILLDNNVSGAVDIIRQIVQTYLLTELDFPTDELTLSLYLIKSELLTNVCNGRAG